MGKDRVLRGIVLLQAVCMIVLTVVVITRVLSPPDGAISGEGEPEEAPEPAGSVPQIVATIGGESITTAELVNQLQLQYGEAVLHTLLVRKAIRLEAEADGISIAPEELQEELAAMMAGYEDEEHYYSEMKNQLGLTPDMIREDAEYRLLLEKIATRDVEISEEELDRYITENMEQFKPHVQYRLSWVVTETKREAQDVLEKLVNGEDFALMARTYSIDADTAAVGGDLGLIESDDPFFEQNVLEAAERLEVGETAGPIAVEGGQAVIKLFEKRETEMDEQKIRETARKQLALSKAVSLQDLEKALLSKYDARIVKKPQPNP